MFNRYVIALNRARIELARATDASMRVGNHFAPVGNPADGTADSEHNREHRKRYVQCPINDAGIKIDFRVLILLDEVFIFECNLLEFERKFEQG